MFVVSELSINYREPARLDDELQATVEPLRVGGATIEFLQTVRRADALLAEGRVQIACVDRESGAPRRLDAGIRKDVMATMAHWAERGRTPSQETL